MSLARTSISAGRTPMSSLVSYGCDGVLNAGDYVYKPAGVLHDATTALEDTVYLFICDETVLYFDDNNFTGFTNWETIEKMKEQAAQLKAAE